MKNYYLIALFTISFGFVNAQTKDTLKSKIRTDLYVGFGAQVQSNLNINQKLINSGLPTIPYTLPEFIVGFGSFGEKYNVSIEFNGIYSDKNNGPNNTKLALFNLRGNFSYNLIANPKYAFAGGLNLTYSINQFDIFNPNTVVDLNNLIPSANSGHISLNYKMLYLGPSISLFLFKHTNWQIRLNAAYEVGVTRGSWKSDFINVTNTVNESGNNRFVFGIVLL